MKTSNTLQKRLLKNIHKKPSGCWVWTGAKNTRGYGNIFVGSIGKKTVTKMVHRVAYEIYKGSIPEGKNVCHSCDNPSCCNPKHLFIATQKENLLDMTIKGRRSNGVTLSEAIKKGWTPELRAYRARQTGERMKLIHEKKAKQAGVPIDWKHCHDCHEWFDRSNFHKNKSSHDGLKSICKSCAIKQTLRLRTTGHASKYQ